LDGLDGKEGFNIRFLYILEHCLPLLNAVDITRLWQSGFKLVMSKLTSPHYISRLNVMFHETKRMKFPNFVSLLPTLKHLFIGPHTPHPYHRTLVMQNFSLERLPSGLETLELDFGNAMASLLFISEINEIPPPRQDFSHFIRQIIVKTGVEPRVVLRFRNLRFFLPSLKHFIVSDYLAYKTNTLIDTTHFLREVIPLKMETLILPKRAFILPKHMRMLPRTLRTLVCVLGGGTEMWEEYEEYEESPEDGEIFPSSLTSLKLIEIPLYTSCILSHARIWRIYRFISLMKRKARDMIQMTLLKAMALL
jgi:hypothetical protein